MTATETLVLRRTFDAPRELVFRAWTDLAELAHWYSPAAAWPVQRATGAVRPGGTAEFAFGPPGEEPWVETNVFREVVPPARLVFEMTLRRGGGVLSETVVTVEFHDRGGRTEVVITDVGRGAEEHATGWGPTLDNLVTHLAR